MMGLGRALVAAFLFAASAHAAWRSEGPFLGAVTDVAVDPVNPDTIYAATDSGGVWRSDDGGKSWMLPGAEMVSRPVVWILARPRASLPVWAGVGTPAPPGVSPPL